LLKNSKVIKQWQVQNLLITLLEKKYTIKKMKELANNGQIEARFWRAKVAQPTHPVTRAHIGT
jgi:hypothetical protein